MVHLLKRCRSVDIDESYCLQDFCRIGVYNTLSMDYRQFAY